MKKKCMHKLLPLILCLVLATATALFAAGCNDKNKDAAPSQAGTEGNVQTDGSVLGEGAKQFALTVVDQEGNETEFEIHTDKETVGEALLELGMVSGEDGEYGLYVKTVNGITADYDKDGTYWAFYINGEYAQTGVDATAITEGDSYSFKVEKM